MILRRGIACAAGSEPLVQTTCKAASRSFTTAGTAYQQTQAVSTQRKAEAPKEFKRRRLTPKDEYHAEKAIRSVFDTYGATPNPHYRPFMLVNNPIKPRDITLESLLAAQSHLGHATSLWNPANQRYIFGIREGIHIISLDVTAAHLRRAAKIVEGVALKGGIILFVGTRDGQERAIIEAARRSKGCHIFQRWIPGTITNRVNLVARSKIKVVDKKDELAEWTFDGDEPVLRPDLVVCMNTLENEVMLHECGMHNIPTIGIIDTDCNPACVTYPIPANDDSLRCVNFIAGILGRAGEAGVAGRYVQEKAREEQMEFASRQQSYEPRQQQMR